MKKHRRSNIKHALAAVLFFAVLSLGMICFADAKGTVIVKSAVIRASADPNSAQIGSVAQGGSIDVIEETTGTDGKAWYHVYVNANTKGYIRSDLVKLKEGETVRKTQGGAASSQPADLSPTTTTAVDAKKASVISNRTNIREGASTNHESVATVNRGMVLTITGEAAGSDGKKWYQVSFAYNNKEITGFIRSDLVTFENVPADAATSEITGEGNGGEEVPETQPEETQPPEPEQPAQPAGNTQIMIPMNVEEEPKYIMPGFKALNITLDGQNYKGYKNGKFFIYYAQNQNGEQGWYLFDSETGVYQRYVYELPDATVPNGNPLGSVGLVPVIVLVAIIIVLVAVVGFLVLKLRGRKEYDDDYEEEYDDETYSDDVEDIGEEEDEEENEEEVPRPPIRRPQPVRSANNAGPQPMRRPQPQGQNVPQQGRPQGPQPIRRPQPQGQSIPQGRPQGPQPVKRPQPQGQSIPLGHPQGQPPVRRPQPQGQNAPQGGRPQRPTVQGQPQGGRPQPQGRRPQPQPSNERPQPQKTSKARVPSEQDDMDFMDI